MTKRILFFDGWTKGIRNFERLCPAFDKLGINYKLFHLGTWVDKSVPMHANIRGIECCDISYYHTDYIANIIKSEKPDLLLMLNLSYVLDRVLVDTCRYYNVKIVYLAHGQLKDVVAKTSLIKILINKLNTKNIKVLMNYYHVNSYLYNRPIFALRNILNLYINKKDPIHNQYSEELHVNKGLVFYKPEMEMFEKERNFPKGMIEAVGNPEMDFVINDELHDKKQFMNLLNLKKDDEYVVYLEDGYVQSKVITPDEWIENILDIKDLCEKAGLKLVLKLHPRTDLSLFCKFFKQHNVIAKLDINFKDLIYNSKAVVSYSSSTIVYGLLLHKNILMPRWGKPYGISESYPSDVVYYVRNKDDFSRLLNSKFPKTNAEKYLKDTLGLIDGKATERIINRITEILDN